MNARWRAPAGMRRRLDLAASIVTRPPVLFLDEPTTGLDPASRQAMWEVIRDLVADGTTVLLTTQYLDEADQLADHIGKFAVVRTGWGVTVRSPAGCHAVAGRCLTMPSNRHPSVL